MLGEVAGRQLQAKVRTRQCVAVKGGRSTSNDLHHVGSDQSKPHEVTHDRNPHDLLTVRRTGVIAGSALLMDCTWSSRPSTELPKTTREAECIAASVRDAALLCGSYNERSRPLSSLLSCPAKGPRPTNSQRPQSQATSGHRRAEAVTQRTSDATR